MGSLSLRSRLLLLGLLPALVGLPLLVLLPERIDRQSVAWAESRSLGVARLLAAAAAPAIDFDDQAGAERTLAQLAAVPGARSAALLHRDGSTLAAWGAGPLPAGPLPAAEQVRLRDDLLQVSVPLTTRGGQRATLVATFDQEELRQRRGELRALSAGVLAMLLGLAVAAAVAVTRLVARPIDRITAVARRITAGEETAREGLDTHRDDEVGTLARAFDVMLRRLWLDRQALQEREQAISALAAGLEARVEERTKALACANDELSGRLAELKAAQEQLVVAERRSGVGQLAAGVAHEINNPLAYVASNVAFVGEELAEAREALARGGPEAVPAALRVLGESLPALAEARQGAARVQQIVRGLKTFSRGDEDVRVPVDVAAALGAAIDMAQNEIKHRARLERHVEPVPFVDGSEVRLAQVFLNLLVNAAQALPEGKAGQHRIGVAVRPDGPGGVLVEVSDTGAGMTPEVQARVFEPFFTTKPKGEGTGLGLPISQGIVHSYGGTIEVESAPGRGSTFRVRLPASTRAAPAAPAPQRLPEVRKRLLVVDDEVAVGAALARSLGRHHDVTVAGSAREALAALEAGPGFDRILCDLEMPEISGPDFREALARRDPALAARIIFMTGGAFTEGARRVVAAERDRIVDKPIDLEKLRRLLSEP